MDSAFCTLDGKEYTSLAFSKLHPAELNMKRRYLVCVKCRTTAYYKKAATSGQGPCFGARPHEDCSMAAPESERGEGGGDERDPRFNPGQLIVIDPNYGAAPGGNGLPPGAAGGNGSRGGAYSGTGARQNATSKRRLRPLLKNLIYSQAFRESLQPIQLPDGQLFPVRTLFVNFLNIAEPHIGQHRGFWGVIYDARLSKKTGSLWLNTGKKDATSVVIDKADVNPFLAYHKVKIAELDGMHVLVFGTLGRTTEGKWWLKPSSKEMTALYDD